MLERDRARFRINFVFDMKTSAQHRQFYRATDVRLYRLSSGVRLADAARAADLTLARASEIERFPERARPGELDSLRQAIARLAQRAR